MRLDGYYLPLCFHLLHPVGGLADHYPVVQSDNGLEIMKEQERPKVNLHIHHVT